MTTAFPLHDDDIHPIIRSIDQISAISKQDDSCSVGQFGQKRRLGDMLTQGLSKDWVLNDLQKAVMDKAFGSFNLRRPSDSLKECCAYLLKVLPKH